MYAVVGLWTMDPAQRDHQEQVLRERIVPLVLSQPGFVQGAWSRELDRDRHTSFISFEDEQSARSFVEVVRANGAEQAAGGVSENELFVVEVIEQA